MTSRVRRRVPRQGNRSRSRRTRTAEPEEDNEKDNAQQSKMRRGWEESCFLRPQVVSPQACDILNLSCQFARSRGNACELVWS